MSVAEAYPADVAQAFEHCRLITKQRARNFYFAFLFLPKRHRPAVYAIYAFCRTCDDYADEPGRLQEKVAALDEHRRRLAACYAGRPSGPVFTALQHVAQQYAISRDLFDDVISGVEMDLTKNRYRTFEELYQYCYRVASVVGLISIEVFGYSDPQARQHAIETGIAMQLVNILRDIREDSGQDRIYLPLEDLERFGYTEKDLLGQVRDERFAALMRHEATRAREYFNRGSKLLPLMPKDSRPCPAILAALYGRLLDRMESGGWNVFERRARLSSLEKLWLASRTWAALTLKRENASSL